jgi:hypothetical protein
VTFERRIERLFDAPPEVVFERSRRIAFRTVGGGSRRLVFIWPSGGMVFDLSSRERLTTWRE